MTNSSSCRTSYGGTYLLFRRANLLVVLPDPSRSGRIRIRIKVESFLKLFHSQNFKKRGGEVQTRGGRGEAAEAVQVGGNDFSSVSD
jgi:hypothetical protein